MSTMIRVLVVTDDGLANGGFLQWTEQDAAVASVEGKTREFHLGEFMRVLQETAWIGFNVEFTKAHRDGGGQLPDAAEAFRADRGADVINFRFDKPFEFKGAERRLSDYDIVLFFPVRVGNANTVYAAEAEAIATFMESGGGFFATGDHEDFGASISGLIPRVRSMRRWYFTGTGQNQSPPGPNGEPPAPPALNPHRHDTTRPGVDGVSNFEDQSDEIAQEITPTLYPAGITVVNGYAGLRYLPHPLLCSPGGVVRYLPDHMHEGSCEVPDKLAERTFKLGAATLREYPDYAPPGVPADYVAQPLAPEIVATSQVLPGVRTPALDAEDHTGGDLAAAGTRFGAIAAWDGHRVGRGRVVVDATWHHFFNINLTGDRYLERASVHLPASQQQKLHGFYVPDGNGGRRPCAEYELIMWYYRNLVYWLIPARRAASVWWQSVIDLTGRSRLAEELASIVRGKSPPTLADYLYLGALAQSYFASARGPARRPRSIRRSSKARFRGSNGSSRSWTHGTPPSAGPVAGQTGEPACWARWAWPPEPMWR